jgi:hypothetical protein
MPHNPHLAQFLHEPHRRQQAHLPAPTVRDVPEPRLVTTAELARALGLAPRTIQKYRKDGLLTPDLESIGGHARWDVDRVREELRRIAAERREER